MRHRTSPSRRRAPRRAGSPATTWALVGGLALSGALVWDSTEAVFTASTANGANSWSTGSVDLADDATSVAFALDGLEPEASGERCVTVTYTGTVVPVDVRLYTADHVDGGLGDHLLLTVTDGTGGSFADCSAFVASTDPVVPLHDGTVNELAARTTFETGAGTWAPATTGEARTYRFAYTVAADAPELSSVSISFVWEARS